MHDMKQVTGTEVDEATVCRFLKKNNFSRTKCRAAIRVSIRLFCL